MDTAFGLWSFYTLRWFVTFEIACHVFPPSTAQKELSGHSVLLFVLCDTLAHRLRLVSESG